jgi:hypothetical protein
VPEEDRVDDDLLGDFLRPRLDHHNGVLGARDDQVDVGLLAVGVGRVETNWPSSRPTRTAPTACENGTVEQVSATEAPLMARMSASFWPSAERTKAMICVSWLKPFGRAAAWPVDQADGQDLFLGRPTLALEPAAGNPARRVRGLAVVHRSAERTRVFLGLLLKTAVASTTVSPNRTTAAPSACLASLPIWMSMDFEPTGMENWSIMVFLSFCSQRRRGGVRFETAMQRRAAAGMPRLGRSGAGTVLLPEAEPLDELVVPVGVLAPEVLQKTGAGGRRAASSPRREWWSFAWTGSASVR